jgi:hypothetical protein
MRSPFRQISEDGLARRRDEMPKMRIGKNGAVAERLRRWGGIGQIKRFGAGNVRPLWRTGALRDELNKTGGAKLRRLIGVIPLSGEFKSVIQSFGHRVVQT